MPMLARITSATTALFPLWVVVAGGLSFFYPGMFTWFTGPWITWGLGIIMLGMGLTLTLEDFKRVGKIPGAVILGILLQYTVMPFLGWASGRLFNLPDPLAVGLILVSCCPGGTASNVISYLARADVPLSVTMTALSTIIAVALTPLLTDFLAGSRMEVDAAGLFLSTVQVVLIPVALGVLIQRYFKRFTAAILPFAPPVAVLTIVLIVASILGANRELIKSSGLVLLAAVFLLHGGGFLLGYLFARLLVPESAARTISIEVGMQNSGLGVVLARANFTNPLVAVPSAISSLFHSVIGSALAAIWSRFPQANPRTKNS
ncbi:MAG: bile acid:sodium symporter family protein [Spirochaetia bacterium]|nr:bile acid:sodium symporter family protein [Spirochaetia bacterium]